jgi:hypothetical protein
MNAFDFFVAAQITRHNRRSDRQREQHQRHHYDDSQKHEAGFPVVCALFWSRHMLAHGLSP